MRRTKGFTLVELLVVVGIIGLLAAILVPTLTKARELANQTVCMGNLSAIGKGIGLYKNQYDNKWPWIQKKDGWNSGWDYGTETGQNREIDPYEDPNNPRDRAITALMFLLVRDGQNVGLFTCPSDGIATVDQNIKWDHDQNEETEDEYYWDFSSHTQVSYSWQAPVIKNNYRVNGISDAENQAIVMADKTPYYDDDQWKMDDLSRVTTADIIRRNMSQNHDGGRRIIALQVGMNVIKSDRPDCGANKDHIYTSSGERKRGSRKSGQHKNLTDHYSVRDTFLIGPAGQREDANAITEPG